MNFALIARGLRLIADGLEDREDETADPTPTAEAGQKRTRRTKAEMEAAKNASANSAANSQAGTTGEMTDRGPAGNATEGNGAATTAGSASTSTATASGQSSGQNGGAPTASSNTGSSDPKGASAAGSDSVTQNQPSDKTQARGTAAGASVSPEQLSELLTTAAKKHGRGLIAELLGGKRVADMTDAERNTVKLKVEALDAEKAGDEW